MQENSTLAERLKRQIKHENETIQNLTQQQLSTMRKELNSILQRELNTIKADINAQTSNIGWNMAKSRVLWPILIGLSLSLGLFSGSWATMQYLSSQIQTMQLTAAKLEEHGGKLEISTCGSKSQFCIKIDKSQGTFGNGQWMIPEGY